MSLEDKQLEILEEIISLGGNCLEAKRCQGCPFRTKCLPQFAMGKSRMSQNQRANYAADVITREELLGETDGASEQYHIPD